MDTTGEPDPSVVARLRQGVADLRRAYGDRGLSEAELAADPYTQVERWLADAVAAGLTEPNAMVLATVGADGQPSARTVLLKGLDPRGFAFFTNLGSRKGRDLAADPRASLVLPWIDLERQVVVVGSVEPVARDEVAAYFATRPRGSRLGAWASRQSEVLAGGREELERRYAEAEGRWPGEAEVPTPEFWGGFRVVPTTVELWQGRPSRLHDRLRYRRDDGSGSASGSGWLVERLSP